MNRFLALVSCLAIGTILGAAGAARSDDVYNVVVQKQDTKKSTGWNLADWLETRDRMRLMDLWLALHSPSPYEFFLDGNYTLANPGNTGAWAAQAAAYASIFGLQFEDGLDANGRSSQSGILDLRIFGLYAQGTNITLQAGVRSLRDSGALYRDALAGVDVTIYLARFFGIEGLYRHYFDSVSAGNATTISEDRFSGSAFIDFSILRVYGEYFSQPATYSAFGALSKISRDGVTLGLRVFF